MRSFVTVSADDPGTENASAVTPEMFGHPLDEATVNSYRAATLVAGGLAPIDHHDAAWRATCLYTLYAIDHPGGSAEMIGEVIRGRSGKYHLRHAIPSEEVLITLTGSATDSLDLPTVRWEMARTALFTKTDWQEVLGATSQGVDSFFSGHVVAGANVEGKLRAILQTARAIEAAIPDRNQRALWLMRGEPRWAEGVSRGRLLRQGGAGSLGAVIGSLQAVIEKSPLN